MTKQHEFPSRPPFDLDLDGVRTCGGYVADGEQEPAEVDDAAARLRIIKRKAALLMARSGLGDAFFPAGQQQWLPSVRARVLTRWPMICVFFAGCIKVAKIRERLFKILYLSARKYRQILFKRR